MNHTVRVIRGDDPKSRVVIFQRANGTFGFSVERWTEPEGAWVPTGRFSESFTATADEAEAEARARAPEFTRIRRDGHAVLVDRMATSADPSLPAFLARPSNSPVYHGFPIVAETWTDGWVYGAITAYESPEGVASGDGFVIAPDGRRAGLVWECELGTPARILPPDEGRWGVYAVWFPRPVRTTADLTACFREVLPYLQAEHRALFGEGPV